MTTIATTGRPADALNPPMPLLDAMIRDLGGLAPSTRGLIGLQHLFGSTATLIRRLCAERIAARDVFLLGKPYSTNPSVMDHLRRDQGCWVHPDSADQPGGAANDAVMDRRIEQTFDRVQRRFRAGALAPEQRIVLIDDGGRAIRAAHDRRYAGLRRHLVCVEQTRCGIRHLQGLELEVPVVNVAESETKLVHESPLIAASVVAELTAKLAALAATGVGVPAGALVIGFGAIGQAVARDLARSGRRVVVYDSDEARRTAARAEGFAVVADLDLALGRTALIVGCTGLPVVTPDHYAAIAPGAVLISASSADVEFTAWNLRRTGECLGTLGSLASSSGKAVAPDRRRDHPCFSLYRCGRGHARFHLVNGGFPVNFNGGVDPIPPRLIQLTRSLLAIGAIQASYSAGVGIEPLDGTAQAHLRARWLGAAVARAA